MGKQITITLAELKKIIKEEDGKFGKMKDVEDTKAKEVKPGDEANQNEHDIDWMKALDIKEMRLRKALLELRKQRKTKMEQVEKKRTVKK